MDRIAEIPLAEILIVEDDPVIALSHTHLVRDMGHFVAGVAATKREAIALNDAASPDLLIIDIRLQGGDNGIDTANAIIKSTSAPVIFVTGHPEDLLSGKKREPAFILTKPFDPEALKAMISHALSFRGTGRVARNAGGTAAEPRTRTDPRPPDADESLLSGLRASELLPGRRRRAGGFR